MDLLRHAKKDYITNCYSREDMNDILRELEEDCKAGQKKFSILVADIDHFKSFNDRYGHFFGDEILKYFAEALRIHLDDFQNIPIRFGGDEFVMIFPEKSAAQVRPLAMNLRDNLGVKPFDYKGCPIRVGFSAGIACYPDDGQTWEDVFEKADRAMYFAKRSGRGRITTYKNITGERLAWSIASGVIAVFTAVMILLNFGHLFVDSFLNGMTRLKTVGDRILARENKKPSPAPQVSPIVPQSPPASTAPPAQSPSDPSPHFMAFHLKSGGVIQGVVEEETPDALVVQLKLSGGRGQVKIQKDNLLKIEEI
ncbi:MAG: diguanylate cyclase [Candidatus Omnitrophica bacterium]|nr:diguanylate cyclase [Candidatus Omnitrophota bacterium]